MGHPKTVLRIFFFFKNSIFSFKFQFPNFLSKSKFFYFLLDILQIFPFSFHPQTFDRNRRNKSYFTLYRKAMLCSPSPWTFKIYCNIKKFFPHWMSQSGARESQKDYTGATMGEKNESRHSAKSSRPKNKFSLIHQFIMEFFENFYNIHIIIIIISNWKHIYYALHRKFQPKASLLCGNGNWSFYDEQ